MRRRHWLWVILALLAVGVGVGLWREVFVDWIEPHPGDVSDGEKSTDLPADLKLM
jgi:hypothetical protein